MRKCPHQSGVPKLALDRSAFIRVIGTIIKREIGTQLQDVAMTDLTVVLMRIVEALGFDMEKPLRVQRSVACLWELGRREC